MKLIRYHFELGAMDDCTNILMEAAKGFGHRALQGLTRDCLLFENWFLLKKSEEANGFIRVDLIGMVKINTKVFFKAMIEMLTKVWPGGYYIVLSIKPMLPEERPLIANGDKYNSGKILSCVAIVGGREH